MCAISIIGYRNPLCSAERKECSQSPERLLTLTVQCALRLRNIQTRFAAKREGFQIKESDDRVYSSDYKYFPKNFTEIDISNILATADIIQTLWLDEKSTDIIVEH